MSDHQSLRYNQVSLGGLTFFKTALGYGYGFSYETVYGYGYGFKFTKPLVKTG